MIDNLGRTQVQRYWENLADIAGTPVWDVVPDVAYRIKFARRLYLEHLDEIAAAEGHLDG